MKSPALDAAVLDGRREGASSSGVRATVSGFVWAGLSVAVLAGWFVVTRAGFRQELRIWDVIALRFGGGALFLTPVLIFGPLKLPLREWLPGIVLAALWGAPFILMVGMGLQSTTAAVASSVTPALMPVFAGFMAWGFFAEIPRKRQLCGYALICTGLVALAHGYASNSGQYASTGIIALIVAAAMWALYALRMRRTRLTSLQAAALICFWSALFYLPFYIGLGHSTLARTPVPELLLQSFYQAVMMSMVAIFAFNRAVLALGARAAAAIIALIPVVASALAIPVLGEWPSLQSSVAIFIIPIGVALSIVTSHQNTTTGELT